MKPIKFRLLLLFLLLAFKFFTAESFCSKTCDIALASYYIQEESLSYISDIRNTLEVSHVNIPFPCDCINGEFLGHTFLYELQVADVINSMAELTLISLTTEDSFDEWVERNNINATVNCSSGVSKGYGLFITYTLRSKYTLESIPKFMKVNVTVNCSFGNREVSTDYGLFITYPLYSKGTFESIANDTKLDAELLKRYNFSQGRGSIFITGKGSIFVMFGVQHVSLGRCLTRKLLNVVASLYSVSTYCEF
jgi:chitin elicitor receptor kinase 1